MRIRPIVLALALVGCGSIEYGDTTVAEEADAPPMYGVTPASSGGSIEVSVFYRELSPYGTWIEVEVLGRVFVPSDPDYRPFREGQWSRNGEVLVWMSYDPIGWAVSHYGAWTVLDDGRWAWVPDTEWSPAQVEWRESEQYVGWAPVLVGSPPAVVVQQSAWVYVQTTYLLADYVTQYAVPRRYYDDLYTSCRPMARAPDRGWLRRRRVRRDISGVYSTARGRGRRGRARGRRRTAQGGSVRVRDGVGSASARDGSVTVRGRRPRATADDGRVTVRGPARETLTESPRRPYAPRETVVLGRGRAGRSSPPPRVSVDPTPAPAVEAPPVRTAPARRAAPPIRTRPTPRVATPPRPAPSPRAVRTPPRRIITRRPTPPTPRPSPRATAPRRIVTSPSPARARPTPPRRTVTARPTPQRRAVTSRPPQRRATPQRSARPQRRATPQRRARPQRRAPAAARGARRSGRAIRRR